MPCYNLKNSFSSDRFVQLLLISGGFWSLLFSSQSLAQITTDNSLGSESSIVTEDVIQGDTLTDLIEGGVVRGNNLFHSFEEFNIPHNHNVYFANPDDVTNILTRVTGNNISEIFGTLGVNGAANLFLLNPNGIVFGENASLDINGSFLATTAASYLFARDLSYSAVNPDTPPLLTINVPVGIQFGSNIGKIEVLGSGHQLNLDYSTLTPITNARPVGLAVPSRNTLALLGGKLKFTGGNLTVAGGNIELASIAQPGQVKLQVPEDGSSLAFDYQNIDTFGDLNLTQAASINISGNRSGSLELHGNKITLQDRATIIANTFGSGNGGDINIQATNSLNIIGTDAGDFPSAIFTQVESEASGRGSNLNIETTALEISNNAFISSKTAGIGNAGDIKIIAQTAELTDRTSAFFGTGVYSEVLSPGRGTAGEINITTDNLTLDNGGQIASETNSNGNGGNIFLQANKLNVLGTSKLLNFASSIHTSVSNSQATGKGGDLTLKTDKLLLQNGGQIASETNGNGNGGNIFLQANELEIIGASSNFGFPSIINTLVNKIDATGNGGDLSINTNSLFLQDGGRINAGTRGQGNSGDLSIDAQDIEVTGISTQFKFPSSIFTSVNKTSLTKTAETGGDLTVNTSNLSLEDGGHISSETNGQENNGNLFVNANKIKISGYSSANGQPSGLFTNTTGANNGGGNLIVEGETLIIKAGGAVDTSASGRGKAGQLTVNTTNSIDISGVGTFSEDDGNWTMFSSGLFANVKSGASGEGGKLTVTTPKLDISDGGQISANTLGTGNAGDIEIRADRIKVRESIATSNQTRSGITSGVELEGRGNGGNIQIVADNLQVIDGGSIAVDAKGDGNAGSIIIDAKDVEVSGILTRNLLLEFTQESKPSSISAFSQGTSSSGIVNINAEQLQILDRGEVSVRNLEQGDAGNIEINVQEVILDRGGQLDAEVNTGIQGNIQLNTNNIQILNHSGINTKATGTARSGNIDINNTENIRLESSSIIADAIQGNAGNIQINTRGLFASPDSVISASSDFALDGEIKVESISTSRNLELSLLPQKPLDSSQKLVEGCNNRDKNYFAYLGRGGLPETLFNDITDQASIADLGNFSSITASQVKVEPLSDGNYNVNYDFATAQVVEAQTWKRNQQGKVELVATHTGNNLISGSNYQCKSVKSR